MGLLKTSMLYLAGLYHLEGVVNWIIRIEFSRKVPRNFVKCFSIFLIDYVINGETNILFTDFKKIADFYKRVS